MSPVCWQPEEAEKPDTFKKVCLDNRSGLHPTRYNDPMKVDVGGALNAEQGSLSLWILPMETLNTQVPPPHITHSEPDAVYWPILTDSAEHMKQGSGNFALFWDGGWYPQLRVQFFKGHLYGTPEPAEKPIALAGHFTFHALKWYQIFITWNDRENRLTLFVNGILVGTQNRFHKLQRAVCGQILSLGFPGIAVGELRMEDTCLDADSVFQAYKKEKTVQDPELDRQIEKTFTGRGLDRFRWDKDTAWETVYSNRLTTTGILKDFYLQGMAEAVEESGDGIRVRTRQERSRPEKDTVQEQGGKFEDRDQVYLWLLPVVVGDVSIEFEFMPLKENGLSMVILQAAGMHGEAFLEDWPRRTNGWMNTVYGENVRNYHWEFFREMDDCRNDVASHVLVKNPWLWPLHYQCQDRLLELNQWHKLQFVQEGARLRGAINGEQVIDCIDTDTTGHGPIYRGGNVGIRCMWKSAFLFRNLKVWQRPRF